MRYAGRKISLICMAALTFWPVSQASAADVADTIFVNGKVFTADARDSVQQAFAISGDRFLAVGSDQAIRAYGGPTTQVVDLQGRFVTPGFGDDHFHNEGGGDGIDLTQTRSIADVLKIVGDAAAKLPAGTVIVSNADWHEAQLKEQRLPTASELDTVSPKHPVVLVRGGHEYILNNAALAKWGITRDTPSPSGGSISRDTSGALTGELFDNAMKLVALPARPPLTVADVLKTQKAVNPYGITSVRIPGAYKSDLDHDYALIEQARASGQLGLRYTVFLPGFDLKSAAEARALISHWQPKLKSGDDWLRIDGVKLMIDGGFEGGHLSQPYEEPWGRGGTYSGIEKVPPEALIAVVGEINRLGWRATTHAVGDVGIDQTLAAYEAADREQPIAGKRWSIEHAFIARPEQLPRIAKLALGLSIQDHLYVVAPVLNKYWGNERASQVTPLKSYLDAGLLVAGGTDSYVIPLNPFLQLYHYLTRDSISAGVYGTNQAVTSRSQLLRLLTINYAKLIGQEQHLGSIEPGKLADFAVLTDNFLTVEPKKILEMKALSTYVGGKEVYRDPAF